MRAQGLCSLNAGGRGYSTLKREHQGCDGTERGEGEKEESFLRPWDSAILEIKPSIPSAVFH